MLLTSLLRPKILFVLIIIGIIPAVLFVNCAENSTDNTEYNLTASSTGCNSGVSTSLKNPQSIDQMMSLIQALPKPLTIDCFISALRKPLKIYAVDNAFSAQPSAGPENPRIFLVNNRLIMSVVPAGIGRFLLEVSQVVGPSVSVKGEIEFPVKTNIPPDSVYTRIRDNAFAGTSCRVCHMNETTYASTQTTSVFASRLIPPDPFKRVSQASMLGQASRCNPEKELYRCLMLRAIFIDGQATDTEFPTGL